MEYQGQGMAPSAALGQARQFVEYPPQTDAPPLGRVSEAEQDTRKLLEGLQSALSHLEQRISPVLRSAAPNGTSTAEKAQREPSPFASSLIANNQKLYALVCYAQDLSSRVDL